MDEATIRLGIVLDEGSLVATSPGVTGLVAEGRTLVETTEIARRLANQVVESCLEQGIRCQIRDSESKWKSPRCPLSPSIFSVPLHGHWTWHKSDVASRQHQPHQLNYGPRPKNARRMWRGGFVMLVLVALSGTLYFYGGDQLDQLDYLLWQYRSLRYEAPAGLLVYTDNREEALRLLRSNAGYRSAHTGHLQPSNPDWRGVGHLPPPLRRPKDGWVSNVYVHERTAEGETWLAMIGLQLHSGPGQRTLQLYAFSRPVVGWKFTLQFRKPGGGNGTSFHFPLSDADELRIFAGQTDVSDPTRLTIRYELNDKMGTIEGIQKSNGVLEMRVLDGPLLSRR